MKKRIFLLLICLLTLAVSICLFTACDETETPDNSGGTTDGGNSGGTTDGGTTDGGNGGGESKPDIYTLTFKADGVEIGKVNFTVETESITAPSVPNKTGYTGVWESYTLGTESMK